MANRTDADLHAGDRDEMRMKFKLHGIRESKVWKEAQEERQDEVRKGIVEKLLARGASHDEIARLLEISVAEVRRLMNGHAHEKTTGR